MSEHDFAGWQAVDTAERISGGPRNAFGDNVRQQRRVTIQNRSHRHNRSSAAFDSREKGKRKSKVQMVCAASDIYEYVHQKVTSSTIKASICAGNVIRLGEEAATAAQSRHLQE